MLTTDLTTENYVAWNLKVYNAEEFWQINNLEEQFKYLASVALLAANSHNTQPWKFQYHKKHDSLKLLIDCRRVLPVSDLIGRQAVISMGCAMANFEVAAQALGCAIEKVILISDSQKILPGDCELEVAEYKISKADIQNIDSDVMLMYQACFTRRVDRGEYDHDKKIDPQILKKIENLGLKYKVKTILISDWGRKVALAELQAQADSFVINNKDFAAELVNDWLIENNSTEYLGMPGNTFRLNSQQTDRIKNRFKNNLGFESDDAVGIAQLGKKGILSCQCVGMLTVDQDTPAQWLNAGIVLELGALLFESQSIAWAVHAGLAEVSQVNMLMLRPIAMTSKRPVILFRAGYLKSNETRSPHSPRLPLEKVWSSHV